jgi:hypothetical protein
LLEFENLEISNKIFIEKSIEHKKYIKMCEKYTQLREVVKTYCGVNSVCNTPPIYN